MKLTSGFEIKPMSHEEVRVLGDWAAIEGWNPGLNDLDIAWDFQAESFVALRKGGKLAGGGCIMNYGGVFGFMGLFIMRADLRNQGIGSQLWEWRRNTLISRLSSGSSIAMDGVFDMVPFYERGGFKSAHRVLRYQGKAKGASSKRVEILSLDDFAIIEPFDYSISGIKRPAFMKRWIGQDGSYLAGIRNNGVLSAYGVARPCREGYKIGPLFADAPDMAEEILLDLMARIEGEQVQIDMPEPNKAATQLAAKMELEMSFGCVRLYYGAPLDLPLHKVFGVTSLEFG